MFIVSSCAYIWCKTNVCILKITWNARTTNQITNEILDTLKTDKVTFAHEATVGKISDAAIFYLMTRGLSEEEAKALIVQGFSEPIAKAFPVEYAVEMNRLINMELEGTIG